MEKEKGKHLCLHQKKVTQKTEFCACIEKNSFSLMVPMLMPMVLFFCYYLFARDKFSPM
jgi:fucose 4-O-acetylase-like acetyltransferase